MKRRINNQPEQNNQGYEAGVLEIIILILSAATGVSESEILSVHRYIISVRLAIDRKLRFNFAEY